MFRRPSEWRIFWEACSRDRLAVGAAALIGLVCLISALAPVLSPYDPTVGDNALRLAPIGTPGHLLGLDGQGRDILSRLIWGGQVSIIIALLPVTVASLISVVLGLVAGFFGGKVDMIIMSALDVFFAFAAVLLAVASAGVLGPGMVNVMLSLTIVLIPYISRVAYMATVTVKSELFGDQARVSGARPSQILFHHILPHTLSPVIVYGSTLVGILIVLGAGRSLPAVGPDPPAPRWGMLCYPATRREPRAERTRPDPLLRRGSAHQERAADAGLARPDRLDGVRRPAELPGSGLHGRQLDRGGPDPPQGPVQARGADQGGGAAAAGGHPGPGAGARQLRSRAGGRHGAAGEDRDRRPLRPRAGDRGAPAHRPGRA